MSGAATIIQLPVRGSTIHTPFPAPLQYLPTLLLALPATLTSYQNRYNRHMRPFAVVHNRTAMALGSILPRSPNLCSEKKHSHYRCIKLNARSNCFCYRLPQSTYGSVQSWRCGIASHHKKVKNLNRRSF